MFELMSRLRRVMMDAGRRSFASSPAIRILRCRAEGLLSLRSLDCRSLLYETTGGTQESIF